jgi:hypothetical protein
MTENPFVAVVTLNYNGSSFLQECIDSILDSDYSNFKVIVVDNGSKDNSLELLERLYGLNDKVIILKNKKNLGYSKGMNVGLDYSFNNLEADFCLVMNNDTFLDKQAISALVEVAQKDEKIGFVTGKVYYADKPNIFQTIGKFSEAGLLNIRYRGKGEIDKGQYDKDCELDFCDDIFWLVSKELYQKTGGYDPEFFLEAEDFDWQLRAKKAGFKIMFAHKAKIWHKVSMVIGKDSPRKAYYDARNPLIAVMKNCEPDIVKTYLRTRIYKIYLPAIIKTALKGKIQKALYMISGICSAMLWKIKNKSVIYEK